MALSERVSQPTGKVRAYLMLAPRHTLPETLLFFKKHLQDAVDALLDVGLEHVSLGQLLVPVRRQPENF
jgi:hypothetical protein